MAFQFLNLDGETRALMLSEVERDEKAGSLYISGRLTAAGVAAYPGLLKAAVTDGDEVALETAIRNGGLLRATETKKTPKGGMTEAKIPVTAAQTLAEGEFNRFYVRALCIRALNGDAKEVEVYRAKDVTNARSESQAKIGMKVDAGKLLADLREHPGINTALGLPPGPNSGLTVKL